MTNAPWAVIDTQSLLDWQFFFNPACKGWLPSLRAGHWRWLATGAMRDELAHVLGRGLDARWQTPPSAVLDFFDAHALVVEAAPPGASRRLPCTDPDDQKFLDLAATHPVRWLVSRDRAVLKLRRRAERLGLTILPPSLWTPGGA